MPTNISGAADSYSPNSTGSRGHEAERRAEGGPILEDEDTDTEESRFLDAEKIGDMASWTGQPSVKGSTETMRMALLTLSAMGLQFVRPPYHGSLS